MPKTATKSAAPVQEEQTSGGLPMGYDVRIKSLKMNGIIRADAAVTINGGFAVRGVSVKEGKNGLFVSMPSYKTGGGEYVDICFPCTAESRAAFDKAVLDAYGQTLTQGLQSQSKQAAEALPLSYKVRILSLNPGEGCLKGTASVSFNDQFAIRKVSIMESSNGLFVSMPGFKGFKGYQDYCFPCTKETFSQFKEAVLDAYAQALTQNQEAGQRLAAEQQEAPNPFAGQAQPDAPAMQM